MSQTAQSAGDLERAAGSAPTGESAPSIDDTAGDPLELVRQTLELTGADAPPLLDDAAPVLDEQVLAGAAGGGDFYLIGLIGGKEVGKSALINALVGRPITRQTSHGPGTETVIAYCHGSIVQPLRELLDRAVPGRYELVTHDIDRLRRQVLVDLPDIDSHFTPHIEITRRMLRHMLFPIWVQSIEKYADAQPQKLLAQVAAGNDSRNFIFCLNKADQLAAQTAAGPLSPNRAADSPVEQIRADYSRRLAIVLGRTEPPRIWLVSATRPGEFDLPELAGELSRQKSSEMVVQSRTRAGRRRRQSLLKWLDAQDLAGRTQLLGRLADDAQELAAQRLAGPILERALPDLLADPAYRAMMTGGVMARRVARWPLVNLVHLLLGPLAFVIRQNTAAGAATNPTSLVEAHFRAPALPLADLVQGTFAQLQQTHPAISGLYRQRKLWDPMAADSAASDLRDQLAATVGRQQGVVRERLAGRGFFGWPFRWLLTIGAAVWFLAAQPILEAALQPSAVRSGREIALLAVQILGVTPLLKSAAFLLIYYVALWLWLQWDTQRRVGRMLSRWRTADHPDPTLNLTTQSMLWMDGLLSPLKDVCRQTGELAGRIEQLRASLGRDGED
jgi:hypothetical protein